MNVKQQGQQQQKLARCIYMYRQSCVGKFYGIKFDGLIYCPKSAFLY